MIIFLEYHVKNEAALIIIRVLECKPAERSKMKNRKRLNDCIYTIFLIIVILFLDILIWNNMIEPVRVVGGRKGVAGHIAEDRDDPNIKNGRNWFRIRNYSFTAKKVTFVLYRTDGGSYQLFDMENLRILDGMSNEERSSVETLSSDITRNFIITIPAMKEMNIRILSQAQDGANAMTARGGPYVKVVCLD